MAQADKKATAGVGATLRALVIIICLGLVIAHLVGAIRGQDAGEGGLIERTFTAAQDTP